MVRLLGLILLIITLIECSTKTQELRGHWHESFNGQTIHCYHITDTLVSLDEFTFGYSKRVENGDIFQSMVPNSSFDQLAEKDVQENHFTIWDTITWTKMPNDMETFLDDISLGLLVRVEPPELLDSQFELPHDTLSFRIYIGQRKSRETQDNEYYIELDEEISSLDKVFNFMCCPNNNVQIAVLHADKDTPDKLMKDVINEILKVGFPKENIYRTVIKKESQAMGLVRCM